jgi:DNA-binding MarR family transcriptional regulator
MPGDNSSHDELIQKLNEATRESSTWTIMFHHAIAEEVGLNITDHKALDILSSRGPMTAGQMAEITGLTTGAVTGVIDRLEKAGYVRRERDPNDRRKVIIQPNPEKAGEELGPLFSHFQNRFIPILQTYDEAELKLLHDYFEQAVRFMQEEIAWMREKGK